jgi:hypothetical protein
MTFGRKFELTSGAATGLLGIIVVLVMLYDEYRISQRLTQEFRLVLGIGVGLMFYIAPALLVAIGSYFHAAFREAWLGRGMLLVGSLFLIVTFLAFELVAGYGAMYMVKLRLLLPLVSIVTLISSFAVRK